MGWFENNHLFFTHSACCKQERGADSGELNTTMLGDVDKSFLKKEEELIILIIQRDIGSGSGNSVCVVGL